MSSYGTLDVEGMPALPDAIAVAAALGVDLSAHRARALRRGLLVDDDLVVGFEPSHAAAAVEVGQARTERVFLLLELPELLDRLAVPSGSGARHARQVIAELGRLRDARPRGSAILADPIGESRQVFAEVARVIDAVTHALAAALSPLPAERLRPVVTRQPEG